MNAPYRVEQGSDGLYHLYIRHPDGSEYEFAAYAHEENARYDGAMATRSRSGANANRRVYGAWGAKR